MYSIINVEQLTSFKLFDINLLYLYVSIEPRDDTTCFKQQSRHRYHRNGTPSVCFGIDVGDVISPKS